MPDIVSIGLGGGSIVRENGNKIGPDSVGYLLTEKAKLEMVRILARNIYFLCCLFNWGWHLIWIFNNFGIINIGHLMYFMVLFWIVKDDIILLSWLNNTMIRF